VSARLSVPPRVHSSKPFAVAGLLLARRVGDIDPLLHAQPALSSSGVGMPVPRCQHTQLAEHRLVFGDVTSILQGAACFGAETLQ